MATLWIDKSEFAIANYLHKRNAIVLFGDTAFDHNIRHIRAAKDYALISLGAVRRHNRKRDERDSRMFALEVATR